MSRPGSDNALRTLERAVMQDPLDVAARIRLYYERYRVGLNDTIRPTLPLLPRPTCFGAMKPLRHVWRYERFVDPDNPFGFNDPLIRVQLQPYQVTNSDFIGKRSVMLTAGQLNEVSRYLLATVGHLAATNAWQYWGIKPAIGVEVCLGLAVQVVGSVFDNESKRFGEESRARKKEAAEKEKAEKKAERARALGEAAKSRAVRQAEEARLLEQLENGTLEPTREYPPGSYEDEVLCMMAAVREEKIARRLAGEPEPEERFNYLIEPSYPLGSWRHCAAERGRECVDRITMDELVAEAGEDDDVLPERVMDFRGQDHRHPWVRSWAKSGARRTVRPDR